MGKNFKSNASITYNVVTFKLANERLTDPDKSDRSTLKTKFGNPTVSSRLFVFTYWYQMCFMNY